MTSELFRFFLLKKFNIVVDLLMNYKSKKKSFIISIFHSSVHQLKKKDFSTKKKKKNLKLNNRKQTSTNLYILLILVTSFRMTKTKFTNSYILLILAMSHKVRERQNF